MSYKSVGKRKKPLNRKEPRTETAAGLKKKFLHLNAVALYFLSQKEKMRVNLGIGKGKDAGKIEIRESDEGLFSVNNGRMIYSSFLGEAFPDCSKFDLVEPECKRGRIVIKLRAKETA